MVFKILFLLIVITLVWFVNKKFFKQTIPNKKNKIIFSFFGAPGSGKGTLAQKCSSDLGHKNLSTGNLFRTHMSNQTELGKLAQKYINDGNLVPDQVTVNMVRIWLKENTNSNTPIILDGFPRTQSQAKIFNNILKNDFPEYQFRIIRLVLPKEEIIDRLINRLMCENKKCQAIYNTSMPEAQSGICPKCGGNLIKRADDKKEVIEKRFEIYQKNETEILDFYKNSNQKIEEINISKLNPKQVFEKFKNIV